MVKTFAELCTHFEKYRPHKVQLGRASKLAINELIDMGQIMMEKSEDEFEQGGGAQGEADGDQEDGSGLTVDDVVVEIGL